MVTGQEMHVTRERMEQGRLPISYIVSIVSIDTTACVH